MIRGVISQTVGESAIGAYFVEHGYGALVRVHGSRIRYIDPWLGETRGGQQTYPFIPGWPLIRITLPFKYLLEHSGPIAHPDYLVMELGRCLAGFRLLGSSKSKYP